MNNIFLFFKILKTDGIKRAFCCFYYKIRKLKFPEIDEIYFPRKPSINSYMIPDLLRDSNKKNKIIVSCAFRPLMGPTGGPNGVLYVEQNIFGNSYKGIPLYYMFQSKLPFFYPPVLEDAIKDLARMVKINFYAAYSFDFCNPIWSKYSNRNDVIFVCHDLGFAYGAYLKNIPYVLIYHTQGSYVNEREGFGEKFSEKDKEITYKMEELVFSNALKVFFPSKGAEEVFRRTAKINFDKIKFSEYPLYNTISDKPKKLNIEKVRKQFHLPLFDKNAKVFLSCGDYSSNKGMERVPLFLNKYVEMYGEKVVWIGIGSKHTAGIYEQLLEEKSDWKFDAYLFGERTIHDNLLSLMEISDYYIMFHRNSIFDLSTLEAMRAQNGLILTEVGGNIEVNKNNNVIFVNPEDDCSLEKAATELHGKNKEEFKLLNESVFNEYFSKENFKKSYEKLFNDIIELV